MYVSVQMPTGLTGEVDILINNQVLGYRSRNEFCVDAVRRRIEILRLTNNQPKSDGIGSEEK